MAKRTPEQVLDSFVKRERKEAKLRSRFAANKQRNWLLAAVLNGFAKFGDKKPPTDFEQLFVGNTLRNAAN